MAVEDAYELAYREAVRALEHQRAEATALRPRRHAARRGLDAVSFGRESFAAARPLGWLAVLCFVLLSLCVWR